MSHLRTSLISHKQAVCSLYKAAIRCIESNEYLRIEQRFLSVLMRERFEKNRNITDPRIAKQLYLDGLDELFYNLHTQPVQFPKCPGGTAYDRNDRVPDWVLDYWHPYEKARYPKYFETREKRKLEYIENYERRKGQLTEQNESQH